MVYDDIIGKWLTITKYPVGEYHLLYQQNYSDINDLFAANICICYCLEVMFINAF